MRRLTVWGVAAAILLAAVVWGALTWGRLRRTPGEVADIPVLTEPPPLDLGGVVEPDPLVNQAIEAARQQVVGSPRSDDAWGRLGMVLRAHGAEAGASNVCFEQAGRLDPMQPRWPHLHGTALLASNPDAAISTLQRAADLCGEGANAIDAPRVKLAEALMARGRMDEAEAHFQSLLRVHPDHPRARLGMGRLLHLRNDEDGAREHLTRAAADPYTRKAAALLMAEVLHHKGEREQAEKQLAAARSLPDDPPWPDTFEQEVERVQLGRKRSLSVALALMRGGRMKEAITLLEQTLAHYPDSERALLLLGLAHSKERNFPAAEKLLRQAAAQSPDAPRVQFNLGICLAGQDRWREAAECYEKAAQLMPDDAESYYELGVCRFRMGDASGAEQALRAAIHCRPIYASAHRQLGELLAKGGRRAEAVDHLQQAVRLNPRDEQARGMLTEAEAAVKAMEFSRP